MLNILSFGIPKTIPITAQQTCMMHIDCPSAAGIYWALCRISNLAMFCHSLLNTFSPRLPLQGAVGRQRSSSKELPVNPTFNTDARLLPRPLHPSNSQPTPHPAVCSPIHTPSHPPLLILTLDLHFSSSPASSEPWRYLRPTSFTGRAWHDCPADVCTTLCLRWGVRCTCWEAAMLLGSLALPWNSTLLRYCTSGCCNVSFSLSITCAVLIVSMYFGCKVYSQSKNIRL